MTERREETDMAKVKAPKTTCQPDPSSKAEELACDARRVQAIAATLADLKHQHMPCRDEAHREWLEDVLLADLETRAGQLVARAEALEVGAPGVTGHPPA